VEELMRASHSVMALGTCGTGETGGRMLAGNC
jgi:hypothetical protein